MTEAVFDPKSNSSTPSTQPRVRRDIGIKRRYAAERRFRM